MLKLALLGGSFDPIHNGHLATAKHAKLALKLDEVHFILAKQSPFKTGGADSDKSPHVTGERGKAARNKKDAQKVSSEMRFQILKTALSEPEYQKLNFKAVDLELKRSTPSYSYQTVEYYREHFPEAQLFWILGEDNYYSLDKWKNYEYLKENLEFIVLRRKEAGAAVADPAPAKNIHFIQNPYYEVSSTQIREAITNGADLDFLAENLPNSIYGLVVRNYK